MNSRNDEERASTIVRGSLIPFPNEEGTHGSTRREASRHRPARHAASAARRPVCSRSTARGCSSRISTGTRPETAAAIPGETAVFGGDLTKDGVSEAIVQRAIDEFGQLDIVVNNAGYTWDGMAHKMNDEQFRAMLEIHTVVPFRLLRAAAPYLRDAGKADKEAGLEVFRKVVNVTSISGTQGNIGQANYSAAKAGGLIGLTKTLARGGARSR